MSDNMRIQETFAKLNYARTHIHQLRKSLSDNYMKTQLLLKTEPGLSPKGMTDLLEMKYTLASALRSAAALNFLLEEDEFSKPREEQYNVYEILHEMEKTLNEILFIDTDIRVEVQKPEADFLITLDIVRLEQILFSIIENTLQYGPPNAKILLSLKKKEGCLHLIIKERSSAVSDDTFRLLFRKYEEVREGTLSPYVRQGLSLALAKQSAEELGGNLLAENQKTGLKFTLILPLTGVRIKAKDINYTLSGEKVIFLFADFLLRKAEKDMQQAGLPVTPYAVSSLDCEK